MSELARTRGLKKSKIRDVTSVHNCCKEEEKGEEEREKREKREREATNAHTLARTVPTYCSSIAGATTIPACSLLLSPSSSR